MYTTTPCSLGFGWLTISGNHIVQYPLHLLSLSSVQDLDSKIDKDEELRFLDPRRFRANIISKYSFLSLCCSRSTMSHLHSSALATNHPCTGVPASCKVPPELYRLTQHH